MRMRHVLLMLALICAAASGLRAAETTCRLYEGINVLISNPEGKDFTATLEVRDINFQSVCPSEMLVRIYPPDGRPTVREVIPDDGVSAPIYEPPIGGWDHQAWYYATCYSRGLEPTARWSAFSDAGRLAAMPKRTFQYPIRGGQKGVYRMVLVGSADLYVTVRTDPDLPFGVGGSPEWLHGHGNLYRKSYIYVPRGTGRILALFMQFDQPCTRTFALRDPDGEVLLSGDASQGLVQRNIVLEPGRLDDKVLALEVSDAPGDYLLNLTLEMRGQSLRDGKVVVTLENHDALQPWRRPQAVTAVLCPDPQTAAATANGAIYHDGKLFWQTYQIRLYDWLKTLKPEDFDYPKDLPKLPDYYSVGSHESPQEGRPGWGDVIMHSYAAHKNRQALNAAILDTYYGLRLIGPGDHVAIGPLSNLAYEMGTYAYFFPRPAWRILQQTDAPEEAKGPIREFVTQICDRLAFCRGMELVNGNALASLVQAMRYCVEAAGDPLNKQLFETYFQRFRSGGLGDRVGVGPSGGVQESFGYDFHYGSYVLRGWQAVLHDLKDPQFQEAYNGVLRMYSYVWSPSGAAPQNSRTSNTATAGGYDSWSPDPEFRWKGNGGPDLTESVNGANEWFAARRNNYYITTYYGRLTPTWMGEGFHGQIGLGGGAICQLHVPGADGGQVLTSRVNHSYGEGMHLSQWRNFHIHGLVGTTADGKPLVAANSEHLNARLAGNTVTGSAEVRESSVRATRSYTFGFADIACSVQLKESTADQVYVLWGGKHGLRAWLTEAYEMIPFEDVAPNEKTGERGPKATRVVALGADGKEAGVLGDNPIQAPAVLIDRHGFGCRLEFEKPMPVTRGQNDTVMVQLIRQQTFANDVSFSYRIVPYLGEPPAAGVVQSVNELVVPLLGPVQDLDAVRAGLAAQEPYAAQDGTRALAQLRFGIAGDRLAVAADVQDPKPVQLSTVWKGACLEVFGSMPDSTKIGQVFLVPAVDEAPAKAYRNEEGRQVPAPDIQVRSKPTEKGYELDALIPFSLLAIDPAKDVCLLEFQVTTTKAIDANGQRTPMHTTLFKSRLAYLENLRYARVRLKEAPAQPQPEVKE